MAKVRIYEIANELNIQSKDIIEFLKEKDILKKTASSAIEGDVIDMVKGKFSKGKSEDQKLEKKKEVSTKAEQEKTEGGKAETVKEKEEAVKLEG